MVKKIIFSIFISFIIAFTIFLGIIQIPEKNQEVIGQSNYLEIQEKFLKLMKKKYSFWVQVIFRHSTQLKSIQK